METEISRAEAQMEADSRAASERYEVLQRTGDGRGKGRGRWLKLKSQRVERGQLGVNTLCCLCRSLNGSEGFSTPCHALLCWCCHYGEMENTDTED